MSSIIVRLDSQGHFDTFWELAEKYLPLLCSFNTAIKLLKQKQAIDLKFNYLGKPEKTAGFKLVLSELLTDYAVQEYFKMLALNKAHKLYGNFHQSLASEGYLPEITNEFIRLMELQQLDYAGQIRDSILDFLQQGNGQDIVFNFNGFFAFRLQHFSAAMGKAVHNTVAEILEHKDYSELVSCLTRFVEQQKAVTPVLNILLYGNGSFELYDEQGLIIREKEIIDELNVVQELGCAYDDTLASAIISLAPSKIIFHLANQHIVINPIIKDILGNRLEICNGCTLCERVTENQV